MNCKNKFARISSRRPEIEQEPFSSHRLGQPVGPKPGINHANRIKLRSKMVFEYFGKLLAGARSGAKTDSETHVRHLAVVGTACAPAHEAMRKLHFSVQHP